MGFLVIDLPAAGGLGLLPAGVMLLLLGGGIALGVWADRMQLHMRRPETLRKAA